MEYSWTPKRIEDAIKEANLSVKDAAFDLRVSKQQLENWIDGVNKPSVTIIPRICKITRKNPSYFFIQSVQQTTGQSDF